MKDNILDTLWSIRVSGNTIQNNEYTGNFSKTNQPSPTPQTGLDSYGLYK